MPESTSISGGFSRLIADLIYSFLAELPALLTLVRSVPPGLTGLCAPLAHPLPPISMISILSALNSHLLFTSFNTEVLSKVLAVSSSLNRVRVVAPTGPYFLP